MVLYACVSLSCFNVLLIVVVSLASEWLRPEIGKSSLESELTFPEPV